MRALFFLLMALVAACAQANEATIRKTLTERLPDLPKIDEVRATPVPGLFEVRIDGDLFYADATGNFLIEGGQLIDTKTRRSLTQARLDQINHIPFASLPLQDAIVWKRGTGARKLVVFADPNCGYCKRLERTLQEAKDVTVYTLLLPILGPDSQQKSTAIWCAKDRSGAWLDWMLRGKNPPVTMGKCDDAALARNLALARQYRVRGTPALVFEDGNRVPGALPLEAIEERLKRAEKS